MRKLTGPTIISDILTAIKLNRDCIICNGFSILIKYDSNSGILHTESPEELSLHGMFNGTRSEVKKLTDDINLYYQSFILADDLLRQSSDLDHLILVFNRDYLQLY